MADEVQEVKEVGPTPENIAEVVTNDPVFSSDEIVLSDGNKYKIMHLDYDDYTAFLTYLTPIFDGLVAHTGVLSGGSTLTPSKIILLCQTSLPELGRLVLKQTVKDITVEQVKKLCPTPFKMAELVMLQIHHNEMIKDFSSFFPQLLTLTKR